MFGFVETARIPSITTWVSREPVQDLKIADNSLSSIVLEQTMVLNRSRDPALATSVERETSKTLDVVGWMDSSIWHLMVSKQRPNTYLAQGNSPHYTCVQKSALAVDA